MRVVAIVVAAGSGERLGAGVPKAFVEVGERTLLGHAVGHLRGGGLEEFVVVAPAGWEAAAEEVVAQVAGGATARVVAGGATRTASVAAGLAALSDDATHVAVHDAARAFVPDVVVADTIRAVVGDEGVVAAAPGLAVPDTLKRVGDAGVVATVDRDGLAAVQTPQVFPVDVLRLGHERAGGGASDDLVLVEDLVAGGVMAGRLVVTPGSPLALKVTTPDDLVVARALARDGQ